VYFNVTQAVNSDHWSKVYHNAFSICIKTTKLMTQKQLEEAQRLAQKWKPRKNLFEKFQSFIYK
jgi:hypothetical protein